MIFGFVQIKLQERKTNTKKADEINSKKKTLNYGDWASVDKAERGGAQTIHVRSALVVTNDISFGCLKNKIQLLQKKLN